MLEKVLENSSLQWSGVHVTTPDEHGMEIKDCEEWREMQERNIYRAGCHQRTFCLLRAWVTGAPGQWTMTMFKIQFLRK